MIENRKHIEVDVIALGIKVLKEWKTLLKFLCPSALIGLVVAFSTPREFTTSVVLAPELSAGASLSSNFSEIASNFGIDLGKNTSMDAIYPELYPDVFISTDFLLELFDVPVRLKDDDTPRTYLDHLLKDTRQPFWTYPKSWIIQLLSKPEVPGKGKNVKDPYKISKVDNELCQAIASSIVCLVDKKTSEITISVTDQDPLVAAIVADTLQHRLQNYITDYRTKKARNDYEYYKKLMTEAKDKYVKSQQQYAHFSDANTDVSLASVSVKRDQLENDMQLQYNAYNHVVAQLKAAEAKVQERIPAFTIIQSPYVTYKPTSTPKIVILFMFLMLGGIADAVWVLGGRELYARMRKKDE